MKNENVEKKVIDIISRVIEVDKKSINANTNLIADLDVESLDLVDLIVAFEDEYNFEIPDNDIKNLQTVNDIVTYIENKKMS